LIPEIPDWDFDKLARLPKIYGIKHLGKVRPGGGTEDNLRNFIQLYYHCTSFPG